MNITRLGFVLLLLSTTATGCATGAHAEREAAPQIASATFAVHCYDVGKTALRTLDGVHEVSNGWHGREEVNRVRYAPAKTSLADMEAALRQAGTFIRVVRPRAPKG